METIKIKVLPLSQWKILKKIILYDENNVNFGCIAYTRSIDQSVNNYMEIMNNIFSGNYPPDDMAELILDAIKGRYPKSKVMSDTILFDVDQNKIDNIKNCGVINNVIIFIIPELSMDELILYSDSENTINGLEIKISVHSSFSYGNFTFFIHKPSYSILDIDNKLKSHKFE